VTLLLSLVGCPDENGNGTDPAPDASADAYSDAMSDPDGGGDVDQAQGSLTVRVVDIDGDPIEDAQVQVSELAMETDADGYAEFGVGAGIWKPKVRADGFASGGIRARVPQGVSMHRTVHLMPLGEPHTFDASSPSDVYEDRVHVRIPADALQDADGNDFSGMAQAHIAPLNPSTDDKAAMPRPLSGILEGDQDPTPMESIFMADIRLTDGSGNDLQLKDGSEATLEFVLPDDLQDDYSIGDQIEAYFFNEALGIWEQDGMGEVIESTYASGKLAWQVNVNHFTWWNCDQPWTDKNCAQVAVTNQSSGNAVSGAQVYVDGVTYNGTSTGTTGPGGDACVDFKLGSTAEVTAVGPNGQLAQVGNATQIMGSNTAATCGGQGSGSCQTVQVQLAPPTCLSGRVVDGNGNTIQGATVTGYYDGANGTESVSATTGSNGEYCLSVPQQADVDVVVTYDDNGTLKSDSTSVMAAGSAQSCGGGGCGSVPDLTPVTGQTGCITGSAVTNDTAGNQAVAAGTHVYAFEPTGGAAGDVKVDCSQPPSQWGNLLSQTTTDANGQFCLSAPVGTGQVAVVIGKCNSSASDPETCLTQRPVGSAVSQAGACGSGSCIQLQEPVYLRDACGEGP
jgi:hypothetical protein